MRRSQNNRAVTVTRAASRPIITDMRHFPAEVGDERAAGAFRNRKAPRMTAVQRNSIGRHSEWNRSPFTPRGGWR